MAADKPGLRLLPTRTSWTLTPDYRDTAVGRHFAAFDMAWAREGEQVSASPVSRVYRVEVDGRIFFLKKYNVPRRMWKRFLGQSKAQAEWRNHLWFESVGIPVARLVAYGRERRGWMTGRGILITEELPHTLDLVQIADRHAHLLRRREWVAEVSRQVARATRIMHHHGFAHNDLKWRNILVDIQADPPRVYFIDCPSGMRWYPPFLEYRIVKDLACLDKRGKYELSRTRRLAFYKEYAGCTRLGESDKARIRKVLDFFEGRE